MPDTTTGTLDNTLISQCCTQLGEETLVVPGFVSLLSLSIGLPHYAGKMFPPSGFDLHSQELVSSHGNPDNENDLADRLAGWLTDWRIVLKGGWWTGFPGVVDWLAVASAQELVC